MKQMSGSGWDHPGQVSKRPRGDGMRVLVALGGLVAGGVVGSVLGGIIITIIAEVVGPERGSSTAAPLIGILILSAIVASPIVAVTRYNRHHPRS